MEGRNALPLARRACRPAKDLHHQGERDEDTVRDEEEGIENEETQTYKPTFAGEADEQKSHPGDGIQEDPHGSNG